MIPGITASRIISAGGSANDPYWQNVVLLMHFDGNLSDEKGASLYAAGTVGFGEGVFNQEAMQLTAGSLGAVESNASSTLYLPADFTIEGWVKPTGTGAFLTRFRSAVGAGNGWQLYLESDGRFSFYERTGGTGAYLLRSVGPNVIDGQWHHIAATRENSVLKLFVDGIEVGSVVRATSYTSATALLSIGFQESGASRYPMLGSIDEVRITNGVARYTANFAPPTEPFPNS